MDDVKMVIVMRTDLNMRKGKMMAQSAHAAMMFISRAIRDHWRCAEVGVRSDGPSFNEPERRQVFEDMEQWLIVDTIQEQG